MSTARLTLQETARHLGCSERTVRSYSRQGLLTQVRVPGDRRRFYDPAEVEELRAAAARGRTAVSHTEFAAMRAQVRRLQATLDVVLRILDTRNEPLGVTAEYAVELLALALDQLRRGRWAPAEIETWSEVFLRLDENDFSVIAAAAADGRPWLPFLRLCTAMSAALPEHPDYKTSLDLQALHKKTAEGRRRLRTSAVIYCELRGATEPELSRFAEYQIPSSVEDLLAPMLRKKR